MTEPTLSAGKTSSEFWLSLAAIVGLTVLVALGKINLTTSMLETVFQLAMVYVAGRAVPKAAQQLRGVGSGKAASRPLAMGKFTFAASECMPTE